MSGKRATCLSLLLVLLSATLGPARATEATVLDKSDGLSIKQFSEAGGEQDILVSGLGIKIHSQRKGLVGIIKPPFQEAIMFNEHTKLIYSCPVATFKSPLAQSMAYFNAVTFVEIKLGLVGPIMHKGLTAGLYTFTPDFDALQRKKFKEHDLAVSGPQSVQCIETTKFRVHPQAIDFLDRFYGLPHTAGLPLDFKYVNFRKTAHHYMYTTQVKAATYRPGDYDVPKGLSRATDFTQLIRDDSSDSGIELLIGK